jgi:hypothetical protein
MARHSMLGMPVVRPTNRSTAWPEPTGSQTPGSDLRQFVGAVDGLKGWVDPEDASVVSDAAQVSEGYVLLPEQGVKAAK